MVLPNYCTFLIVLGPFSSLWAENRNLNGLKEYVDKLVVSNRLDYVAISNKYVDEHLLDDFKNYVNVKKLDPLQLPDVNPALSWHKHIASATVKEGWLEGLSGVKRKRNTKVHFEYPILRLGIPLTCEPLKGGYSYMGRASVVKGDFKVFGAFILTALKPKFLLDIYINVVDYKVDMEDFSVTSVGKVNGDFTGDFSGNISSILIDTVVPFVRPVLNSILEENLTDGFESIFDAHNENTCKLMENCL